MARYDWSPILGAMEKDFSSSTGWESGDATTFVKCVKKFESEGQNITTKVELLFREELMTLLHEDKSNQEKHVSP